MSLTCSAVSGDGYAIAGINDGGSHVGYSYSISQRIPFVVRLNERGKLEWAKIYNIGLNQLSRILTFSDSSFMLLFPGDESQTIRLDSKGNVLWTRQDNDSYKKTASDFDINDAIVDKNDFIYANGNFNNAYPALMKMDKNGKQLWVYSYNSPSYIGNNCLSLVLTKGNQIILSNTGTFSDGPKTTFIETDTNGKVLSAKTVPDIKLNAYTKSIQVSDLILDAMADSGFAFIGTDSINGSLIAKADKYGTIGCNSQDITINSTFHITVFDSFKVYALKGYLVSDTSINLISAKNKATMICSNHYYPIANLGPEAVICNGLTDTLNAGIYNAGFKILWSTGDTTYSTVARKTGAYWLQISHNYCSSSDTVNIIFRDQIKPRLEDQYSICPYDSVFIQNFDTTVSDLYWSVPGKKTIANGKTIWAKTSGMYYLKLPETSVCPVVDSFQVIHYKLPKAIAGPDTLICHNQTYTMKGSGGIKYKWIPADYLSSDSIPDPTLVIGDTESYKLVVIDARGCRDTSKKVTIRTRPVLRVKANASDTFGCYDKNIYLFAKGRGGDSVQYHFDWPQDGLVGDSVSINVYKSAWHEVVLSDNCTPLSATDSIYVRVVPPAKAEFDFTPHSPVQVNSPVSFHNQSEYASSYLWNFGTGDSSHLVSPVYTYIDSNRYKITLVAYGLEGCPNDTTYEYIKIVDNTVAIYIPNAFTPDGNGVNDFFDITGVGIKSYKYNIYNRWGENIFNSTASDHGWDGTFKGVPVMEGVYMYQVEVIDILAHQHFLKGTITLMR